MELSKADHSVSPPRVDIPRDYNAAEDLIGRNLAAGRSDKTAYIDDSGSTSYGELARRVNRFASALAGARRRHGAARDAGDARYGRLADRVPGRDPRRRGAGGGQYAAHHQGLRVHARGFPRARAARVRSAAAAVRAAAGQAAVPEARRRFGQGRQGPHGVPRPAGEGQGRISRRAHHARRRLLLALLLGLDRNAQGHGARALEHDSHRRALRQAHPRHPRGRRRVLRGEAVLRLRPWQRAVVPALGRRHYGADGRAADAGGGVQAHRREEADHLLRRADAVRGDACRPGAAEKGRTQSSRLHLGGRGAAAAHRADVQGEDRGRDSRRHRLDRDAAHLPFQPPGRRALRHHRQAGAGL